MKYSSRRSFLANLSALALASRVRSWASQPASLLYAGTYTNDKGSTSQGIYAFRWDPDEGTLSLEGLSAATVNPSFLTFSPDRRHLCAVNEVDEYRGSKTGSVTAFAAERNSSKLKLINTVPSAGAGPCKITVDHSGKAAFVANYGRRQRRILSNIKKRRPQQTRFHVPIHRPRGRPGAPGRSSHPLHHRVS